MSRFFDKVTDYTKVGHAVTADFLQMATTENGLQTLEELCGEGIENAKDAVAGLNTMLEEFITIAESAESLMDCTKINTIFVHIFHRAACTSATSSLLWTFFILNITIVLGALVMLFRGVVTYSNPVQREEAPRMKLSCHKFEYEEAQFVNNFSPPKHDAIRPMVGTMPLQESEDHLSQFGIT